MSDWHPIPSADRYSVYFRTMPDRLPLLARHLFASCLPYDIAMQVVVVLAGRDYVGQVWIEQDKR